MAEQYRASSVLGRWVVETQLPAINGLTAWVTIADCGKPEIEDLMFPGLARERNAEAIAAALNDQTRAERAEAELAAVMAESAMVSRELDIATEQFVALKAERDRLREENNSLNNLLDQTRKGFRDGKDMYGLFQILFVNWDRLRAVHASPGPSK